MSPSALNFNNRTDPHQWSPNVGHEDGQITELRRPVAPKTPSRMTFKSTSPIKTPGHGKTYSPNLDLSVSSDDLRENRKCGDESKSPRRKPKTIDTTSTKETADDPFAGMNTVVDYQQEIERLKVALAQSDTKVTNKRSPGAQSKNEQATPPASEPFVSQAEQERFIAFMRMWTGGSQRWNNCSRCF
ncbi:unnamed protein product [Umbelopsis vinacea]